MPERVHERLDGETGLLDTANKKSDPLLTENISAKSRKRKREHVDYAKLRERAKELEPHRRSLPIYQHMDSVSYFNGKHDQRQQSNKYEGTQPPALTESKSKRKRHSEDNVRPSNDSQQLKHRAKSLESFRQSLPIMSYLVEIREALLEKDVVILVGETGSGKSTQVPQTLVDEPWCKPQSVSVPWKAPMVLPKTVRVGGCVAITEPRRIAATTLARRVAEETGTALGRYSPKSTVGYSVRFDQSTSQNTRIKYLTEGVLLQEMLGDPWLKAYSVVVVDEVHERGVNVDLLLGFLRKMVAGKNEGRGGIPLKVVIMSATAEAETLRAFFEEAYGGEGGNGVREEDEMGTEWSDWSGISSSDEEDAVAIHNNGIAPGPYFEVKEYGGEGENGVREDRQDQGNGTNVLEHQDEMETEWSGISSSDEEDAVAIHNNGIAPGPYFEVKEYGGEGENGVREDRQDQGNGTNVLEHQDEMETEWSGISSSDEEDAVAIHNNGIAPGPHFEVRELQSKTTNRVAICYIKGRQYPVTLIYTAGHAQNIVEASLRIIFKIHRGQPMPGDVLVFFHGREIIESLERLVKEVARDMGPGLPKLLVLPLFAALSQAAQNQVFQPAPPNTRKIIIATNIAETSLTVPGVRFVIDSGMVKIKHFQTSTGMESLLPKPISQSSAIQRQGRAGREAPGQCYRLYSEPYYRTMQVSNTPEILRYDLSHAILTMLARGVSDIVNFPLLDRPPQDALEKAMLQLWFLGALTEKGGISNIGRQIAKLPVTVCLAKALIAAAEPELDCVSEVIDIVSCLSVEDLFLNLTSEDKKKEAEVARRELYKREGDHLTLLTAIQAYAAENTDRKAWAKKYFVSHRAMKAAIDIRKQLRAQCQQSNMLKPTYTQEPSAITPELTTSILKSFIKGFATKTARLCPDGSYKTMIGNEIIAIHPSSVLFGKKVGAIMFNEFVFTKRGYAKGVSAIQLVWVPEELERAAPRAELLT